jgi:hypothetical protein
MQHLPVFTVQVLDKQILGRFGGVESRAQDLCGRGADIIVVARRQGQERAGLDGVFLVGRRTGGDGASLLGDVLGVSDLGEGAHVVEAMGDLLDGYESEDA